MSVFRRLFLCLIVCTLQACGDRSAQPESPSADNEEQTERDDRSKADATGRIVVSDETAHALGINVSSAGPASIREVLSLYGSVKIDAARVRKVPARYPGIVQSISRNVGDRVRAGEQLAIVQSSESLENYAVNSPIGGVITARAANPGEASGDEPLFIVTDASIAWADLSLLPRDRARVAVGQQARVRAADGSQESEAPIALIGSLGSPGATTLLARVILSNEAGQWVPGQLVTGEITINEHSAAVAVNAEGVQTVDGRAVVFVRAPGGFEPRYVTVGRDDGRFVEIVSGLKAGEQYAASGSFVLKAELAKGEIADDDD